MGLGRARLVSSARFHPCVNWIAMPTAAWSLGSPSCRWRHCVVRRWRGVSCPLRMAWLFRCRLSGVVGVVCPWSWRWRTLCSCVGVRFTAVSPASGGFPWRHCGGGGGGVVHGVVTYRRRVRTHIRVARNMAFPARDTWRQAPSSAWAHARCAVYMCSAPCYNPCHHTAQACTPCGLVA